MSSENADGMEVTWGQHAQMTKLFEHVARLEQKVDTLLLSRKQL